MSENMISGWLNINKAKNISSSKIVSLIKKNYPKQKIGHCGTLDVEAEGVLPIALGEATKLTSFLMDAKKKYLFTIQFGATTDTADSSGKITASTSNLPSISQCYQVCENFIGTITQNPPKYSALKVNGKRAYDLARAGVDFQLASRNINIYSLECLTVDINKATATYLVECSKGTYIRSLAEDIALCLQSLGFVIELRRMQVGDFVIDEALEIGNHSDITLLQDMLQQKIIPIEFVLDDIPVFDVNDELALKIRFGLTIDLSINQEVSKCWIRHKNKLLAIGEINNGRYITKRVFNL